MTDVERRCCQLRELLERAFAGFATHPHFVHNVWFVHATLLLVLF
jgi:hypothetical protein